MACPIVLVEDLPVRLDRSRGGKEPIIMPNNDGGWFEVVGTQEEYDEARVFRAKLRASRWCWLRRRWALGSVWVKHRLGMDSLHEGRQCATPDPPKPMPPVNPQLPMGGDSISF